MNIKVDYCIGILYWKNARIFCCLFSWCMKKINNVAIIYKRDNNMFTTIIDFETENSADSCLSCEAQNEVDKSEKIRMIKRKTSESTDVEASGKKRQDPQINSEDFREEVEQLKNQESYYKKFGRWLIGISWRRLLPKQSKVKKQIARQRMKKRLVYVRKYRKY